MRYYEFRLNELNVRANPDGSISRGSDIPLISNELRAGPPYPPADREAVKDMQEKLQEIGYSVGNTGIDGKYGPRTRRAVQAFKQDYRTHVSNQDPAVMNTVDLEVLARVGNGIPKVQTPTAIPQNGSAVSPQDLESLNFGGEQNDQAKNIADEFLGRELSEQEWNWLVRATVAEASPNPEEQAAVMAVILNRVRQGYQGGRTVQDILNQDNQFQAVTGTRYDRSPSRNFSNPTRTQVAGVVQATIDHLSSANDSWLNFTSNNPRAYGPGTDPSFRNTVARSRGARVIGQTVFGTV